MWFIWHIYKDNNVLRYVRLDQNTYVHKQTVCVWATNKHIAFLLHPVSTFHFSICLSCLFSILNIFHLPCMPFLPVVMVTVKSPTRAVVLKMAVQRRGFDREPPRPGSACSLKRSPLVQAELCEARPSSACSRPSPLSKKWVEKVKWGWGIKARVEGWLWPACACLSLHLNSAVCLLIQERAYRSPEKKSSLPRPAKSLTRHIPAAEQEDNSTPSRPTCKNLHGPKPSDCLLPRLIASLLTRLFVLYFNSQHLPLPTCCFTPDFPFLFPSSVKRSEQRTPGLEEPLVWQVEHLVDPFRPFTPSSSTSVY